MKLRVGVIFCGIYLGWSCYAEIQSMNNKTSCFAYRSVRFNSPKMVILKIVCLHLSKIVLKRAIIT